MDLIHRRLHFRTTAWTPATATTDGTQLPACWWKADALSLNNNDAVSSWADSSGNGRTLSQTDAGYRPVYKANQINGLPAVAFTGDFMNFTGPAATDNLTHFLVLDDNVTNGRIYGLGANNYYTFYELSNKIYLRSTDSTACAIVFDGVGTRGTRLLENLTKYRVPTEFRINGALQTVSAFAETATIAFNNLGGSSAYLTANVAESILYTTNLSTADQLQVRQYLATKWGITI